MASYFYENRLFLPKTTAERAENLINTLKEILIEFDTSQMGNDEYKPDPSGLWRQSYQKLKEEVPPILEELEEEFKEILGFIENRS